MNIYHKFPSFSICLFICLLTITVSAQEKPINYIITAEDFLTAVKNNQNVDSYINTFKHLDLKQLSGQLGTDDQKYAFWLNIYNAYIQVILKNNPEKYNNRSNFFKEKQINIGGRMFSFAKIEHGILRRSQYELGLGYFTLPFRSKAERMLRVKKRNWRIHFALNCGAKSCPPVAIYDVDRLDEQLEISTKKYLDKFTSIDTKAKTANVTSLFSWFRGDFGGKKGVKDILINQGFIKDRKIDLKFSSYDWTLDLGNFIEI